MNSVKISLFALLLIAAICFVAQVAEAGKSKGDVIVVGGHKGCGGVLLKTSKKKGDIVVVNPCNKKEYGHETHHSYGGYDMGGDDHGYDMGGHGYDDHGY